MLKFALVVSSLISFTNSQYVYNPLNPPDYCKNQAEACQFQGQVHFACNNNGDFAPTCSAVRDVVPMTQARTDLLLKLHNAFRSKVASGLLIGGLNGAIFPPASRMATLKWSQELSDLALLNVKQCKMQHDGCHNTVEFKFSGQNLGVSSSSASFKDPDMVIDGLVNAWFNEYKAANGTNVAVLGDSFTSAPIGHFLTAVIDRSTHMGCAMTKFIRQGGWKTYLLSCNYASVCISGYQIYRAGETASACLTGANPEYPGLCSLQEPIDPNKF